MTPIAAEGRMLIDGNLVEAEGGRTYANVNPTTEEVIGQVADASVADMDRAITAAKNDDITSGMRIVRRALEEPVRQIANNAGQEGSVIVNHVRDLEEGKGYDAQNDKYVDMVRAGIIDPTNVVRSALQNAASIAGLRLTTEALISEIPDEKGAAAAPAPHGMGGDF